MVLWGLGGGPFTRRRLVHVGELLAGWAVAAFEPARDPVRLAFLWQAQGQNWRLFTEATNVGASAPSEEETDTGG